MVGDLYLESIHADVSDAHYHGNEWLHKLGVYPGVLDMRWTHRRELCLT